MSDPIGPGEERLTLTEEDTAQLFESLDQALTGGAEKDKKVEKQLGKKLGIGASVVGLLTALVLTFGPRVNFSIGEPTQSPKAPTESPAPQVVGTTCATQAALDAALIRLSQLERCPIKPPASTEFRPGVEDSTCARLLETEDRQQLLAQALAAFNRGSLGPNWEMPGPGQFEIQPSPPPIFKTDSVYPGSPTR